MVGAGRGICHRGGARVIGAVHASSGRGTRHRGEAYVIPSEARDLAGVFPGAARRKGPRSPRRPPPVPLSMIWRGGTSVGVRARRPLPPGNAARRAPVTPPRDLPFEADRFPRRAMTTPGHPVKTPMQKGPPLPCHSRPFQRSAHPAPASARYSSSLPPRAARASPIPPDQPISPGRPGRRTLLPRPRSS